MIDRTKRYWTFGLSPSVNYRRWFGCLETTPFAAPIMLMRCASQNFLLPLDKVGNFCYSIITHLISR